MPEVGTFWELLSRRVEATPDASMLLDEYGERMSFAAYQEASESTAAGLLALGVAPGSRVSYQLPTRIGTIVLMGALARLGAIQNPIVPAYRESEVGFCLEETRAEFLCIPAVPGSIDYEAVCGITDPMIELIPCLPQLPTGDPATLPPPPAEPNAVRWIYYTSGTTSRPKGARHSDQTVATASAGLVSRHQINIGDRLGMAFPFTHVGGLINVLSLFQVGHPMVIVEAFEPAKTARLFAQHDVSVVGGGPVFYAAFLEEQRRQPDRPLLPRFRLFSGGGAPMPSELHYEVQREMGGRGCLHGFGMTECGIVCANDVEDRDERLACTEGRPIDGVELRIRAFDGRPAEAREEGEIELQGGAVCHGYVDPAATAEAFDAEGWFRTGDIGFVDEQGYLTITGRRKDIIIRKGENISAHEIEDLLYAHPKVADAAVVGLPDRERGELVCAVVTTAADSADLGFEEMAEHFREARVMRQKIPERLEIVDAIPRNATGKVLKHVLRGRFG
jgi:acyl-CoA synthetase (AMP-forming)/AMP-acid ligase II